MKVLFFTPHAALWVHTAPEALLARGLSELGHEISYLTCGKAQTYCSCMTAAGMLPTVQAAQAAMVCADCQQGVDVLLGSYAFSGAQLAEYLSPQDHEVCTEIAGSAVRERTLDTTHLGVRAGNIALYEFTLMHKKMSTQLTESQWGDYGVFLKNALLTLTAFARHIERHKPDVVIAFSPQYSNINTCMQYAMQQDVRVLFIESGTNLSHRLGTMRAWDWKVHGLVNPALTYWGQSGDHPVSKEAAQAVTNHFRQLLGGQHYAVFSAPYQGGRGIRQRWTSIRDGQKVVLLTLSSYDEAYAALLIGAFPESKVFSDVFRTQKEWLEATMRWAGSRPEIFFVIRVHPRDFPNKREAFRSEQSYELERLLAEVPDNVHVNWPSEGVSLYEILEDADAVVTGWSVTAMEALILGIPVVTYDQRLPSYPEDIILTGRSVDQYFSNIDSALCRGWSFDNVRNGFRWLAYNFVECTLKVSSSHGRHELAGRSFVQRVAQKVKNRVPALGRRVDLMDWRGAIEAAGILETMLVNALDAIPPAKSRGAQLRMSEPSESEDQIIERELQQLLNLLSVDAAFPDDKAGLARNIRSHLNRRVVA